MGGLGHPGGRRGRQRLTRLGGARDGGRRRVGGAAGTRCARAEGRHGDDGSGEHKGERTDVETGLHRWDLRGGLPTDHTVARTCKQNPRGTSGFRKGVSPSQAARVNRRARPGESPICLIGQAGGRRGRLLVARSSSAAPAAASRAPRSNGDWPADGHSWPWVTFAVNIAGTALLAFVVMAIGGRLYRLSPNARDRLLRRPDDVLDAATRGARASSTTTTSCSARPTRARSIGAVDCSPRAR